MTETPKHERTQAAGVASDCNDLLGDSTPGPWQLYADTPSTEPNWHIVTNNSRMRIIANVHIEPENAVDLANARLIQRAPELLASLRELLAAMEEYQMDVGEPPPFKHRQMMDRAYAALSLNADYAALEKTMNLSNEHLKILRHMLGIDVDDTPNPREYRDYYCSNRDDPVLWEMANLGVVERYASDRYYDWYRTTDAGKDAARASQRAMLLPKPKRIYLRWLSISDVCPDLTFRDFLTQPEYAETRRAA